MQLLYLYTMYTIALLNYIQHMPVTTLSVYKKVSEHSLITYIIPIAFCTKLLFNNYLPAIVFILGTKALCYISKHS